MLPFGDFMKSKFFTCLLLATAISSGFADVSPVSTLKERDAMIQEALSKEDPLKVINEAQQNDQVKHYLKTDDKNYVVVIKKEGDKYIRVAHSKKERLEEKNRVVEASLEGAMKKAEESLNNTSGPIPFSFSTSETMWAVLSKKDGYMIFNICASEEDVKTLLRSSDKPADKPIEKPAEITPAAVPPFVTAEKSVEAAPTATTTTSDKTDAKPADAAKEPVKTDEKKQEAVTPTLTTPDKTDVKPADAAQEQTKTETLSSEKKSEVAPAVEKKAVSDTVPVKIESGKADQVKAEVAGPVAAAAA